jgi:hypothetical protein
VSGIPYDSNFGNARLVASAAALPVAAIPIAATAMASDDRRLFEIEAEAVKLDSAIECVAGLLGDVREGADERKIISVALATRQWNKRRQMPLASCGFNQKKEKFSSLTDQFYSLIDAAAKIQAATLAGVQCKARLAMLDMRTELVESMVEDLCSISDRASPPHTLRLS